ncbi:tyrosine-type recombinase/integrase [Acinetobacter sp. SFA]|uniref:tyrosine-type recombinase/integrase n=1 Tax=Acinetobacter sp. SFA TaxID=1805633 RepID=UPI0007D0A005|nr:tyrosine-type recombinase/integrase [Acinetobacter sp. SFA]OAL82811.1 hypothetical protein AY607_00045 [Acinetobacter sp. SFA]
MSKIAKFASERRHTERKQVIQKEMQQAQSFIQTHLPLDDLFEAYQNHQHIGLLEKLEAAIEREASSVRYKKMLYHCYRKQIMLFNHTHEIELDLPSRQFLSIERETIEFNREWLERSKYVQMIHQKLWRYWNTAQQFTDIEVIGNILISSILFAGISTRNTLDAFLDQVQQGLIIQHLGAVDLHFIFLEPLSPGYGDIYHPEAPLRKSRTLVLDRITQLWLARYLMQPPPVHMNAFDYLSIIFRKMGFTGQYSEISKLLASASSHWMQLDNVTLDPALSHCLEEKNETCGLNIESFKNYLDPQLFSAQLNDGLISNKPSVKYSTAVKNEQSLANIKKLHRYLLKTIRHHQDGLTELIDYMNQEHAVLSEASIRICLWLISLFHPGKAQVQHLSQLFNLDAEAWLKYLGYQQKLRRSSIYSYYAKFAEAWWLHTLPYMEDPDFNAHLENIYSRIMGENTRSSHQKFDLLRRFHHFQKILFKTEDFPLYRDIQASSHPKTQIISAKVFCAVLDLLPAYAERGSYDQHDAEMLKLIFTLAFRTGMRINEILGLRIKDLEGPSCTSLWIRPYRSSQQEHTLKTDSAERNIPVSTLLCSKEHDAFKDYCLSRRLSLNKDDYLFTLWNSSERLSSHFVSQIFSNLTSSVLPGHPYSFHTLRHSAANHLALVLNMPYELVKVFSNYSQQDYDRIRSDLLRSTAAQDIWYILAHLLGHITPKETFKSYLHLCFIIAGYQLIQYDPPIPAQTLKTIHPGLSIKPTSKNIHTSSLSPMLRLSLASERLKHSSSSRRNAKKPNPSIRLKTDRGNENSYPGTVQSSISVHMAVQVIRHCERFDDIDYIARKLNLPPALIQGCKDNICKLQMLKNQKGRSRFMLDPDKGGRILPCVETFEEKKLITYFFKQLANYSKENKNLIRALKIFIHKVNTSESGLIFNIKEWDQLNTFLEGIHPLFPSQYWAIEMPHIIKNKDLGQVLWLNKINQSNPIYGNFKNSFRICLKSKKSDKSLSFLKYSLILLCIFNQKVFI